MMPNMSDLQTWLQDTLEQGYDENTVREQMRAHGYSDFDINEAFEDKDQHSSSSFPTHQKTKRKQERSCKDSNEKIIIASIGTLVGILLLAILAVIGVRVVDTIPLVGAMIQPFLLAGIVIATIGLIIYAISYVLKTARYRKAVKMMYRYMPRVVADHKVPSIISIVALLMLAIVFFASSYVGNEAVIVAVQLLSMLGMGAAFAVLTYIFTSCSWNYFRARKAADNGQEHRMQYFSILRFVLISILYIVIQVVLQILVSLFAAISVWSLFLLFPLVLIFNFVLAQAYAAFIFENKSPVAALLRGAYLSWHKFWDIFFFMTTNITVVFIVQLFCLILFMIPFIGIIVGSAILLVLSLFLIFLHTELYYQISHKY